MMNKSARAVPLTAKEIATGLNAVINIKRNLLFKRNYVQDWYNKAIPRERKAVCLLARLSERHTHMTYEDMNEAERAMLIDGMRIMKSLVDSFPRDLSQAYSVLVTK